MSPIRPRPRTLGGFPCSGGVALVGVVPSDSSLPNLLVAVGGLPCGPVGVVMLRSSQAALACGVAALSLFLLGLALHPRFVASQWGVVLVHSLVLVDTTDGGGIAGRIGRGSVAALVTGRVAI